MPRCSTYNLNLGRKKRKLLSPIPDGVENVSNVVQPEVAARKDEFELKQGEVKLKQKATKTKRTRGDLVLTSGNRTMHFLPCYDDHHGCPTPCTHDVISCHAGAMGPASLLQNSRKLHEGDHGKTIVVDLVAEEVMESF